MWWLENTSILLSNLTVLAFPARIECVNFIESGLQEQILRTFVVNYSFIWGTSWAFIRQLAWIRLDGIAQPKVRSFKAYSRLFWFFNLFRSLRGWVRTNWLTSCRGLEAQVQQPPRLNLTAAEQPLTTMMTFKESEEKNHKTKIKTPIFEPTFTAEIFLKVMLYCFLFNIKWIKLKDKSIKLYSIPTLLFVGMGIRLIGRYLLLKSLTNSVSQYILLHTFWNNLL